MRNVHQSRTTLELKTLLYDHPTAGVSAVLPSSGGAERPCVFFNVAKSRSLPLFLFHQRWQKFLSPERISMRLKTEQKGIMKTKEVEAE